MKFLIYVFLLSATVNAHQLPKEITNELLQVKSIHLVQQLYPNGFYAVTMLSSERETLPTEEFAYGFNYLSFSNGNCAVVAVSAESRTCHDLKTCVLEGDSMELPGCDFRSNGAQVKAALTKMKTRKRPYVLGRHCDQKSQCTVKWYKR